MHLQSINNNQKENSLRYIIFNFLVHLYNIEQSYGLSLAFPAFNVIIINFAWAQKKFLYLHCDIVQAKQQSINKQYSNKPEFVNNRRRSFKFWLKDLESHGKNRKYWLWSEKVLNILRKLFHLYFAAIPFWKVLSPQLKNIINENLEHKFH